MFAAILNSIQKAPTNRPGKIIKPIVLMISLSILNLVNGCRPDVADIEQPPPVSDADKRYAGVFEPLNGSWEGMFRVYTDSSGQRWSPVQPRPIDSMDTRIARLHPEVEVRVTQVYVSETPFFQRVTITDRYTAADGSEQVIISRGANKVQDGTLWCVVYKPEEIVVHSGRTLGSHTLIWERELRNPTRIEYFEESMTDSSYVINGWGYYDGDNPNLSPRVWFRGTYRRVNRPIPMQ